MNGIRQQRNKKYALGQEFAPDVNPAWAEEFVLELRLKGAAGDDIGAALAEVNSHCAESGDTAEEVFGPARAYAASLNLPVNPDQESRSFVSDTLPTMGQLLGMMLMIWSAPGVGAGEPASVSAGMLLIFLFIGLIIVAVNWKAAAVMGFVARHRTASIVIFVVVLASLLLPAFVLQEPAVELLAPMLLIIGAGVLAAATVLEFLRSSRNRYTDDVLAAPLEEQQKISRRRRAVRRADYLRIFMMPAFAVAMTAALAITAAIS
ncbi:hypothetical protein [Nesterenkonia muleiensis]|uniref:hypothetical protein n=1 Tax=Nesterenkonia muleiensis TaxID=2282648 RepID=UPI000E73432C|nr:hypothetical protein [Nesterenkonia muleiensis]